MRNRQFAFVTTTQFLYNLIFTRHILHSKFYNQNLAVKVGLLLNKLRKFSLILQKKSAIQQQKLDNCQIRDSLLNFGNFLLLIWQQSNFCCQKGDFLISKFRVSYYSSLTLPLKQYKIVFLWLKISVYCIPAIPTRTKFSFFPKTTA